MQTLRSTILTTFLLTSITLSAQQDFSIQNYTTKDGLSHRAVYDIEQDSLGLMWFATYDGLNRFDGTQFVAFRPSEKDHIIHHDHLQSLTVADNGRIILRTSPAGDRRFSFDQISTDFELLTKAQYQEAIVLFKKKTQQNHTTTIDGNGILHYSQVDGASSGAIKLPVSTSKNPYKLRSIENAEHELIYNQDHFFLFNFNTSTLSALPNLGIHIVFTTYQDREGNIWLGHELGLTKIRPAQNLFENHFHQPFKNGRTQAIGMSARTMVETADGIIYLHDDSGKFFRLNPSTGATETINYQFKKETNELQGLNIEHMLLGLDGYIWMVTRFPRELMRYTIQDGSWKHYAGLKNDSYLIFEDFMDRLWLVGPRGCTLFDKKKNAFYTPENLKQGAYFGSMTPDRKTLWIQQEKGLLKIDCATLSSTFIPIFENTREIRQILFYHNYYWLATQFGLVRMHPETYQTKSFNRKQGLPGNYVYSILADKDVLWLGTEGGLCRFNAQNFETQNYYVDDGLSQDEFNTFSTLKTRDGKIYMGGLNGINAFYPDVLKNNRNDLPIRLINYSKTTGQRDSLVTRSTLDWNTGRTITLNYLDKNLSLRLALMSYVNPIENQYAYYLDGLEDNWNYSGNNPLAIYHKIPPGDYIFRAKAADPFGTWSSNELAIPIHVKQAWYKTPYAISIYILLTLLSFYFFYRFQLNRKLEKQETKRLKELDAVKTKLYTNITHEFRTPLTVIQGMADQIEENPAKSKEMIKRNSQNLLHLINQMLDLAKLESGNLQLKIIQSNIIPYLEYLTESFYSYASSKDIRLVFYKETDDITMDFDEDKIHVIITNLLSNAIKFTGKRGKIVLHAKEEGQHDNRNLLIKVKDDGIGIPAEKLPFIFDRFYQVDETGTNEHIRKGDGTGIGLALTKELVGLMGGSIGVKSSSGTGTEFSILLPIRQTGTVEAAAKPVAQVAFIPVPAAENDTIEAVDDRGLPILLVIDDNVDVRSYISSILLNLYRVVIAENGAAGIEKALELIPDLIISDVMMPEKDGFEVTETLKKDERTSHIPIILLTAKADINSKIQGLEQGVDAYLSKPFNKKELLARIENLLELRAKLQAHYANLSPEQAPTHPEDKFLLKIKDIIYDKLSDAEFSVAQLSRKVGLSQSQLYRKIIALTNKSTATYIRSIRLHKGKELLQAGELTVAEVAYEVGFTDPAYFSRAFSETFGVSPNAMRK